MRQQLRSLLVVEPFIARKETKSVHVHLLSAGTDFLRMQRQEHWREEVTTDSKYFKNGLEHGGHISGINAEAQKQILEDREFCACLILFHERQ